MRFPPLILQGRFPGSVGSSALPKATQHIAAGPAISEPDLGRILGGKKHSCLAQTSYLTKQDLFAPNKEPMWNHFQSHGCPNWGTSVLLPN